MILETTFVSVEIVYRCLETSTPPIVHLLWKLMEQNRSQPCAGLK